MTGAAFSFLSGSGARIYFIIATGVFTVLVIIALATNFISGKVSRWSLVLVTAGGLANCIDRVIYGYVQDMFKVELFNFAIFNVADVFITVFAIVFVLAMIFEKPGTTTLRMRSSRMKRTRRTRRMLLRAQACATSSAP